MVETVSVMILNNKASLLKKVCCFEVNNSANGNGII